MRALHGLARALAQNAVTGVSTGFTKELDIVGVGYKAQVEGKKVVFYKVNLELINIETSEKVWIGDKEIKKVIGQSKYKP